LPFSAHNQSRQAFLTAATFSGALAGGTLDPKVLDSKGRVTDQQVEAVRQAGFSDGQIAEIIAAVALNVLTNYFNIAAQVDVDFPKISLAL
jgi:hypothetical protein